MKGGIYKNKGRHGAKYIVKFKGTFKRVQSYGDAERLLTGLRYKFDEGSYDERDYQRDKPLGFRNQAEHWLEYRKTQVKCFRNLTSHMGRAISYFEQTNIKTIEFAELEDFLYSLPEGLSNKTKANIFATLHSLWVWVNRRDGITIPRFPQIKYTLGWRNTVDKETQGRIIEEVKRITTFNPKIHLGIKWLATYVAIRPIELINIKEGDFDLSLGVVNVRHNKEDKPKIVPLLDEDIKLLRSLPTALPYLFFFRHDRKRKGVHADKRHQFGKDYFYSWWKKACHNLGIKDIDLYGGTRHSSVCALRERFTPEQIKRATMHSTNIAFERYYRIELDDVRKVYADTVSETNLKPNIGGSEKGKLLKLEGKNGAEGGT